MPESTGALETNAAPVPWDKLIKLGEKLAITAGLVVMVALGKIETELCIALLGGVYGIPAAISGARKVRGRAKPASKPEATTP